MKNITYLPVHTLKDGHTDSVISLAFSTSGTFLASGGEDAQVIVWDTDKGILVTRVTLQSPVLSLLWDMHNGTALFCGCQDGTLLLFPDMIQVIIFVTGRRVSFNVIDDRSPHFLETCQRI
jgi:WD40 repeat protein